MIDFPKTSNFALLLQSIRLDDPASVLDDAEKIIGSNVIDWEDLYKRADFHCIKPQVSNFLNKVSLQLIPDSIRENLREANLENLYRQMRNLAEFFEIKRMLDEAGIVAIPFKGFWLAHAFYGNLAERESVDVDILVDIKDLEKIKTIMASRGYVPEAPLEQLTTEHIVNELCEYNFDKYEGDSRIFHFEFHWRISATVQGMDIKLAELATQIIPATIQSKAVQVFTPSANLLLAVMHHGGKDQFLQLKQVLDIALILNTPTGIDWAWVISEAKRFHVEFLVYTAVGIASQLTGISIPGALQKEVNSKFIRGLVNNRIQMMVQPIENWDSWQQYFSRWKFQIRSRSSTSLKIGLIVNEIRKGILPRLIPKKIHYLFLNKKIRIKTVN